MEIIFNKIGYKNIENINLNIDEAKITALSGDITKEVIAKLLVGFIKPDTGDISIDEIKINHFSKNKDLQKLVGYIFFDASHYLKNLSVKNEIMLNLKLIKCTNKKEKLLELINLTKINSKIILNKSLTISAFDQIKVMLASLLAANVKILVFNQPDKKLSFKEQDELKRIIMNLKKKYHLTILIITNNANFYFDIADNILVFDNYQLKYQGNNEILYKPNLSKLIDIPPIIKLIKEYEKKYKKIPHYTEIDEIMKEIYRNLTTK